LLPVIGIKSGYITTLIVSLIIGYINYYTAQLIVMHLGKEKDIRKAVLVHFDYDRKYVKIYSFFIWLSFLPCFCVNFKVICLQIEGLMGYHYDLLGPILSITLIIGIIHDLGINYNA
jgi:hypothetical protein